MSDDLGTKREQLPRVLGLTTALCVIVGSVIGSGIFIVPAKVAREIPAIGPIALAWVVGGLFSLAGALTITELAAMIPRAGGPYVYLRAAYGPLMGFLFGWTEFLVIRAGSVATLAAAFALYASQLLPRPAGLDPAWFQTSLALGAMLSVTVINVLGTRAGGAVQVLGTALKLGALGTMIVLPFLLSDARIDNWRTTLPAPASGSMLTGFLVAMVSVLWAYDGWINTSSLAEEIRDPERNIPRAMFLGMAILIAVYVTMTLVYHAVLSMPEVASAASEGGSPRVTAAVFCQRLLGLRGLVAISLVVMCSTLISLNGNALSGPRAYFAMARDGLFPKALCRIHPRFRTPANAVIAQCVWSMLLTVVGTVLIVTPPPESANLPGPIRNAWRTLHAQPLYDVMYSYVIFGGTLIYLLAISSVFVLRRRHPDWPRPYRTWGYPITPLVYIGSALILLHNMYRTAPFQSVAGLGIIAAGIPAYRAFSRSARRESRTHDETNPSA